jgi:hypothetical protein
MSVNTTGPWHLREYDINRVIRHTMLHFQTEARSEDAKIDLWFVKLLFILEQKRPMDPTANHGCLIPLACRIVP